MSAERIGLLLLGSKRSEDLAVSEAPLLDLIVVALDVGAELREVRAQPPLDLLEPRVLRVIVRVDAAHFDQVVMDLLDHERLDETLGLVPVRLLTGLECDELDREPHLLGPAESGFG